MRESSFLLRCRLGSVESSLYMVEKQAAAVKSRNQWEQISSAALPRERHIFGWNTIDIISFLFHSTRFSGACMVWRVHWRSLVAHTMWEINERNTAPNILQLKLNLCGRMIASTVGFGLQRVCSFPNCVHTMFRRCDFFFHSPMSILHSFALHCSVYQPAREHEMKQ